MRTYSRKALHFYHDPLSATLLADSGRVLCADAPRQLLQSVVGLEKNLMIVRNLSQMHPLFHGIREGHKLTPTTIDVWIMVTYGTLTVPQSFAYRYSSVILKQGVE